ncbi:MAG: hypothetical protein KJ057_12190 [Phycisphaerae bacterium]|nr:hypothetical protein [Planctomycetia bacterium]MCL4719223.1 hypothetical protein [Phycisphaerae bacterium]
MYILHLFSLLWMLPLPGLSGKPPELVEAELHRRRIETAQIEWTLVPPANDGHGYREALHTSRVAYGDVIEVYHGLSDGRGHVEASPGEPFSYSERRLLIKDGEQWQYYAETPGANVNDIPERHMLYRNLRDLGFEPTPALSAHPTWYRQPAASYDPAEHHEDRVTVTGHWDNGMSVRWTLDPEKGMQPVRVEMLSGSEVLGACDTEYEQFDGLWFPKQCTFSHRGSTTVTISVLSAEFNRPEHPKELTPKDLGMVPGTQVSHTSLQQTAWTGEKLIPLIDWLNMAEAGEVDNSAWDEVVRRCQSPTGLGRYPKVVNDDFLGLTSVVARKPGLWEDYTRRFIQRFRLEGEQIDRAWTHLKECQKPAYAYLDEQKSVIREAEAERAKVAAELAKIEADRTKPAANPAPSAGAGTKDETSAGDSPQERSAAQAPDPTGAQPTDNAEAKPRAALQEQLGKLDERLKKLYEPIERIFEEKLKPGLAKLPTPAQIDAARVRESEPRRIIRPS